MAHRYDLVVIGMGSGGIVAARLAASVGLKVAVVERHRIGGDCLWTGCVPSKALLASARVAHHLRTADRYGLPAVRPRIDPTLVWQRIHAVQAEIEASDDNPDAFREIGVEIVEGAARVTGPHAVEVGARVLDTRFILLSTGSRPATPAIPGLTAAGFLTSESIFQRPPPERLVALGGGPVGVELSQGLARLGARVTLLQRGPRLLQRDEPALADILAGVLREEGVDVRLGMSPERVAVERGHKVVHTPAGAFEADEILVATGRTPAVDGLGLDEIGVRTSPDGVEVDRRMRTSVRSIYAAGDVTGGPRFTHAAAYQAAVAFRNMFFPGWTRSPALVPWCTFTEPELAHAGMTHAQAIERFGASRVRVLRADLGRSDRARTDGATTGAVLLVTARRRLVGAHVLAPAAGEIVHELALAIAERKRVIDLAGLVHVYPTIGTSVNLLLAQAAEELVLRYRWTMRLAR